LGMPGGGRFVNDRDKEKWLGVLFFSCLLLGTIAVILCKP
jgi:hypothetical protein